jgi:hypothetical protein
VTTKDSTIPDLEMTRTNRRDVENLKVPVNAILSLICSIGSFWAKEKDNKYTITILGDI